MTNADVFVAALGIFIIYSSVHFLIIQFMRDWKARTTYEKFITVAGIVSIVLIFLGTIATNKQ